MTKVAEHVKKKHAVDTTTDTIANYVKRKIRQV
jgi:predicted small metal-binding protein